MQYKSIFYGIIASLSLLTLYATVMTLLSGWQATVEQFQSFWYLMVPLVVGFGIQIALYTNISTAMKTNAQVSMKTSGVTSGATMLACCVHHLTDVAPFLGLAGLSMFLTRYQVPILTFGIAMNFIGIFVILKHLKKFTL